MSRSMDDLFKELKVNKLPTLPHVIVEILDACQNANADFSKMSQIISHDAVMSSKLIVVANSASYFQRQKVTTINRALLLIGTDKVKTIALTVAVQQFFTEFESRQTEYLKAFWTSSLRCALLAKAFATLTSFTRPETAYLTGLLHNIGELALRTNFPAEYARIDNTKWHDSSLLTARESALLRTNHCDFGAWLASRWGLGEFASAAIKYHHENLSLILDAHHLVKIIYVASHLSAADRLTQKRGVAAAGKLFNLTPDLVNEINKKITQEVASIADSLNIELKTGEADAKKIRLQDEKKQLKLAQQVRNISLLNTAKDHLHTSRTPTELLQAIEDTAFMLFGYSGARLLLIDENTQLLRYLDHHTGNQQDTAQEEVALEVPLQQHRSIMADAIIADDAISSVQWAHTNGKLPVFDQHLLTLLNTPHMLCIPIRRQPKGRTSQGTHFGVLALGFASSGHGVPPSIKMLRTFAENVGVRFQRVQEEIAAGKDSLTLEQQQLHMREINHEVSNPLTIIRNYLDILSGRLNDKNTAQQEITIIREEIDRAGQILLRLSETDPQQNESLATDINHEISGLIKLFSASMFLTHDINCRTELDNKLEPQQIQRSYLRQILVNLIKNAVEAMSEGGELFIGTHHQVNVNGRRFTEIVVCDTGPGLPESAIPTLFEPNNSIDNNQHAGLGLSITKSLIDELRGTISCRNTRQGAQFQVLIPSKAAMTPNHQLSNQQDQD